MKAILFSIYCILTLTSSVAQSTFILNQSTDLYKSPNLSEKDFLRTIPAGKEVTVTKLSNCLWITVEFSINANESSILKGYTSLNTKLESTDKILTVEKSHRSQEVDEKNDVDLGDADSYFDKFGDNTISKIHYSPVLTPPGAQPVRRPSGGGCSVSDNDVYSP